MRAGVFRGPGRLAVEDVPTPAVGAGDVLIRVRAASICGTDQRIMRHGHFKLPAGTPRVLGHELAGEVVATGGPVPGIALGDRVSVTPNVGCGRCRWCRQGLNNMCPDYEAFGITLDGGFADHVLVPAFAVARGNVFALPPTLDFASAALVEPFSCCVRGQDALGVGPDDTVVVVGTGPIGLLHVALAKLAGARTVIAANRSAGRLAQARATGADVVVETGREDLATAVAEATGGEGADVVITCASSAEVQAQAVELVGTHGRVNFFSGLGTPQGVPVDTNRLHYRGITLTGTTGSSNADYGRALRLAGDGRIDLRHLVTRTFPLDDLAEAFRYAASGHGLKTMIVPTHGDLPTPSRGAAS